MPLDLGTGRRFGLKLKAIEDSFFILLSFYPFSLLAIAKLNDLAVFFSSYPL
jgi:hypothetical protein